MYGNKNIYILIHLLFVLYFSSAEDIVLYEKGQSLLDARVIYKTEMIREALIHTEEDYGSYKIRTNAPIMNALQARKYLQAGEKLNVYIALTNPEWESETIPIRIPIRKGLLSYRLLLIHKDDQDLYKDITTIDDLKRLKVGLQHGWTTTLIMQDAGFDVVTGTSYDGLFLMLNNKRFHYIPRGVNEIYGEVEARKEQLFNVMVEPNLALYIISPTYIFVSKKYPQLAERLELGLERMIEDGTLDRIFHEYYDESIKRAELEKRTVIEIPNSLLPIETPLHRRVLWHDPLSN